MIRSAQMMLARGIQIIKLSDYDFDKNLLTESSNINVIIETLLLFLDSYLRYEEIKENRNFKEIINKVISEFDDNNITNYKNEYIVNTVLPPFSIQNICKVAELIDKFPGDWFSDINMSFIFNNLNEELRPIINMEIISFKEGVVYNSDILNKCFEMQEGEVDQINESDSLITDNKIYTFRKSGIIFISQRLGIDKFPSEYFQSLKEIFQINNNLGIIGGKSHLSYYFIGIADNNLIYLDPHFNQKCLDNYHDLQVNLSTYLKKEIYQMPIKSMTPGFTVGFCFRNILEYSKLVAQLKLFSAKEYACLKFCEKNVSAEDHYNLNINIDDF
jgi:hypothetical protein